MISHPHADHTNLSVIKGYKDPKKVKQIDPAPFAPDEFEVHGREVFLRCPNG